MPNEEVVVPSRWQERRLSSARFGARSGHALGRRDRSRGRRCTPHSRGLMRGIRRRCLRPLGAGATRRPRAPPLRDRREPGNRSGRGRPRVPRALVRAPRDRARMARSRSTPARLQHGVARRTRGRVRVERHGPHGGLSGGAAVKPLAMTGALDAMVVRRIAETSRFVMDVYASETLPRFSAGFKSACRVRLMHAMVRSSLAGGGLEQKARGACRSANPTWPRPTSSSRRSTSRVSRCSAFVSRGKSVTP